MKKILLFSFFLAHLCANAQNDILFSDDFSDNKGEWSLGTTEFATKEIKDGKFVIKALMDNKVLSSTKKQYIHPEKDFTFELTTAFVEGEGVEGFGMELTGDKRRFFFLIAPTGKYWIGHLQAGKWTTLKDWTGNSNIKKETAQNTLKIHRENDDLTLFINDVNVYKCAGNEVKNITDFGFTICDKMIATFDNMVFKQDKSPIKLLAGMPATLKKEKLGAGVNNKFDEKCPLISPDGKTIYFTYDSYKKDDNAQEEQDDIWFSQRQKDNTWGQATKIGKPLNNDGHNFMISITPDNNTALLGNIYNADGTLSGGGISITNKNKAGEWEMPTKVNIENFYNRNSFNEFCLSSDKKVLIMAVERDETHGSKDLYVSFLDENTNKWSEPKNLGATVSTYGKEVSPFLAADGVTLYYSTDGLPGFGSHDVFVTKRLDDTWTNWSEPENLGNAINTDAWDAYYTIPASGEYAYMSSSKDGINNSSDIIRIALPKSARPKPVVLVYGNVYDSKTKKPLGVNIAYSNLKATTNVGKNLGTASSNATDGSYKIVLPAGILYGFLGKKEEYYPVSQNIDLSKLTEYKEIRRDLYLSPIEVGQTIRLNNLFFDFGKFHLREESKAELDRLILLLKTHQKLNIQILGHTDNVGLPADNENLSTNRAKSVLEYLSNNGIDAGRLSFKGFGAAKPIEKNTTEEGRQSNRRVEFLIL